MARYNPPTKVQSISIPYLALVTRADEEFQRRKHREVEYEFAGKVFLADPYIRGAYDGELFTGSMNLASAASNVSAVARAPDWSITANKFIEDSTTDFHFLYCSISKSAENINYVVSGDFKYNGRDIAFGFASADLNSGVYCIVGLSDVRVLTAPNSYGSGFTPGELSVRLSSNGYVTIVLTGTSDTSTAVLPFIQSSVGAENLYTGDGVSGFFYTNLSFQELNT